MRLQHGFSTSASATITNNSSSSSTSGIIGTNTNANNNSSGSGGSNGASCVGYPSASATAAAVSELDPQAYAGRSDTTGNLDLAAAGCPRFCGFGEATGSTWSKIIASANTVNGVSSSNSSSTGSVSGPAPVDLAYMRWLKALAAHCRNTRAEAAVDADPERRRSEVRCFRTLEVKVGTNIPFLRKIVIISIWPEYLRFFVCTVDECQTIANATVRSSGRRYSLLGHCGWIGNRSGLLWGY